MVVGGTGWTQVAAGNVHTCGRHSTGRLYCWGFNQEGQVGIGAYSPLVVPAPAQVAGSATDWNSVASGLRSSCARTRSGRLFCWGNDQYGTLGHGNEGSVPDPSEVYAP